jgi:hypothetical protein
MNIVASIGILVASIRRLPLAVVAQGVVGGTDIPNAARGAGGSAESSCCPFQNNVRMEHFLLLRG